MKSEYLRAACMIPHALSLPLYCNLEQLREIKASAMKGKVHVLPQYREKTTVNMSVEIEL